MYRQRKSAQHERERERERGGGGRGRERQREGEGGKEEVREGEQKRKRQTERERGRESVKQVSLKAYLMDNKVSVVNLVLVHGLYGFPGCVFVFEFQDPDHQNINIFHTNN